MLKGFCIKVLLVLFPVAAIISIVNYCVDPTNVYHSEEYADMIIKCFSASKNATNVMELNDRIYKRKLAEANRNSHVEYLVVGSSRVMTISSDIIGSNLLNLGMNSGNMYDLVTSYEICKENDITFDKIIIGLDYYSLANSDDDRWETNSKYFYHFLNEQDQPFHFNMFYDVLVNLFSLSYFQKSISSSFSARDELKATDALCNDTRTYHIDGSMCYQSEIRHRSQIDIDAKAESYYVKDCTVVNEKLVGYFEMMLEDLNKKGIEIYFYFAPYHPIYYSRICQNETILDSDSRLHKIAEKYGVETIGSFDPNEVGCETSDFYDAAHPRTEKVNMIFQELFLKEK